MPIEDDCYWLAGSEPASVALPLEEALTIVFQPDGRAYRKNGRFEEGDSYFIVEESNEAHRDYFGELRARIIIDSRKRILSAIAIYGQRNVVL